MKTCRYVEKAILIVAFAVAVLSFVLSYVMDEAQGYSGVITYGLVANGVLGAGIVMLFLTLGICFTMLDKNKALRYTGYGLVGTGEIIMLVIGIIGIVSGGGAMSTIFALVSGILFVIFMIFAFVTRLISLIKYGSADRFEGSKAAAFRTELLGWKSLLDDGLITEEEFEAKRAEIVGTISGNKQ